MSAELKEHERELISAYADGEVTEDERREVEKLLKREDAKAWLNQVKATSILVKQHGAMRAPVGLSGRVMAGLEDEFKTTKPAAEAPVIPSLNWRTPMYAAAAAIIVVVGIMFGPQLMGPQPTPPASVALDDIPDAPEEGFNPEDAKPEGTLNDGKSEADFADTMDEQSRFARDVSESLKKEAQGSESDPARTRRASPRDQADAPKDDWGAPATGESGAVEDKPEGTNADDGSNTVKKAGMGGARGGSSGGVVEDVLGEEEKRKSGKNEDRKLEELDQRPGSQQPQEPDEKEGKADKDSNAQEDAESESPESDAGKPTRREDRDVGRSAQPAPTPPSAEAHPKENDELGESDDTVELELSQAGLAAQNDVIWLSSLYGEVEPSDDEEADGEEVRIELSAARVNELVTALRKLAAEQGYGEVSVLSDELKRLQATDEETADADVTRGIKGYLPVAPDEDDDDEVVSVVIRLK